MNQLKEVVGQRHRLDDVIVGLVVPVAGYKLRGQAREIDQRDSQILVFPDLEPQHRVIGVVVQPGITLFTFEKRPSERRDLLSSIETSNVQEAHIPAWRGGGDPVDLAAGGQVEDVAVGRRVIDPHGVEVARDDEVGWPTNDAVERPFDAESLRNGLIPESKVVGVLAALEVEEQQAVILPIKAHGQKQARPDVVALAFELQSLGPEHLQSLVDGDEDLLPARAPKCSTFHDATENSLVIRSPPRRAGRPSSKAAERRSRPRLAGSQDQQRRT